MEREEGNGGADICACQVISWSWRGGAQSMEMAEKEREKEGRAPDSKASSRG